MEGDILGNKVSIVQGDITRSGAGALVVPQFDNDVSTGGVGGAVLRSGARAGLQAYERFLQSHNGRAEFGTAFLTEAGGGLSPMLIHVVSVGSGKDKEFATVQSCMYNALKAAEKANIKSLAVPALGTGIIGDLTDRQSAEAMMSALHQYKQEGGQDIAVQFVIFGSTAATTAFADVLQNKSYQSAAAHQRGEREFHFGRWIVSQELDYNLNQEFNRTHDDGRDVHRGVVTSVDLAQKPLTLRPPVRKNNKP